MGSSNSKAFVSDPARFATSLDDNATKDATRQYDYVIVGGGLNFISRLTYCIDWKLSLLQVPQVAY